MPVLPLASSSAEHDFVLLDKHSLLPETLSAWHSQDSSIWTFNPSLVEDGTDSWILAYRLIGPDRKRRIALCRLDRHFLPIEGSHIAFSDLVCFSSKEAPDAHAQGWFADPRLFRVGPRLFIYWNSGWHEPHNCQFIHELHSATLMPVGSPRELVASFPRQRLEKNWTFFECGSVYSVYSPFPQVILELASLAGSGPLLCTAKYRQETEAVAFSQRHGLPRGGSSPRLLGDYFYSFCHSIEGAEGHYRYRPSVYRFAAKAPFELDAVPLAPLPLPNPLGFSHSMEPLNPAIAQVIYPCGAVPRDGFWHISYGLNDEACALCRMPFEAVDQYLQRL